MKHVILLICAVVALVGCGKKAAMPKLITDPIVEKAIRNQEMQLEMNTGELTKADLEEVGGLDLRDTKITTEGLKEVAKLQQLSFLHLRYTQTTDAGLKEVAKLQKLKWLSLNSTQITDAGLKELVKCKQLSRLYLHNIKVTNAGVAELRKAMPECYIEHFFE